MSPLSPTSTLAPLFRDTSYGDTSQVVPAGSYGLRSRIHSPAAMKASPGRPEDCISDMKTLETFLQEQEEKELKAQMGDYSSLTCSLLQVTCKHKRPDIYISKFTS